jgi:hypothetical protein
MQANSYIDEDKIDNAGYPVNTVREPRERLRHIPLPDLDGAAKDRKPDFPEVYETARRFL